MANCHINKYLLIDTRVIDKVFNAELCLGEISKSCNNPLFTEEKQWEVRFDNLYPNVIYDRQDKIYKCWYSPFITSPPEENTPVNKRSVSIWKEMPLYPRELAVCYAISKNGINWQKPDLGICEFKGSRRNNIVYRLPSNVKDAGVHGAGVFKDLHDSDEQRRYKMFFTDNQKAMSVAFSSDGMHWSRPVCCKEIDALGDTHNNAFWDVQSKRYIGVTRLWDKRNYSKPVRLVGLTESKDFTKWTKAKVILEGSDIDRQIYSMIAFTYAKLHLGLITILDETTDLVHCELAFSDDVNNWQRLCPDKALIELGERGSYDCGCIYPAASPLEFNNEIRLYYLGSNGPHTGWRSGFLCLATLRKDGFAGYEQKDKGKPGVVITRPLELTGRNIYLTVDEIGRAHV